MRERYEPGGVDMAFCLSCERMVAMLLCPRLEGIDDSLNWWIMPTDIGAVAGTEAYLKKRFREGTAH